MRSISGTIVPLLVMLMTGCSTVDADECWPNTSGGFGGGGTIPTGAGVGATSSGDFIDPPPKEPLDYDEADNPCVEGNVVTKYFEPSNFPFVVIVADDGTDKGGGWQEAKAGLIFGPTPTGGTACVATIGMPLRTYAWGNVPPSIAAIYTAKAANAAAKVLDDNGSFKFPPGIFCSRFDTEMQTQFDTLYKGMGAKVTVKSP
jgi:hypothetical protein